MSGGGGGLEKKLSSTHTAQHTPPNSPPWVCGDLSRARLFGAYILPLTNRHKSTTIILLVVCAVSGAEAYGLQVGYPLTSGAAPRPPAVARPHCKPAAPRPSPRTDGGWQSGLYRRTVRLLSTARSAPFTWAARGPLTGPHYNGPHRAGGHHLDEHGAGNRKGAPRAQATARRRAPPLAGGAADAPDSLGHEYRPPPTNVRGTSPQPFLA